jgi:hypothetical protein
LDVFCNSLLQAMAKRKFGGNQESRDSDKQFRQRIKEQRRKRNAAAEALHPGSGADRADTEPSHEHRQNDRNQRRGNTELRHRQAQPNQLVQDPAKSGDEKE